MLHSHLSFLIHWNPPGGGAPPPTHSWRTCARGLVLAGVLGVLGSLGILATNVKKIVPEPVQIEPRGLKNRAWGFQNRAWSLPRRYFFKSFNLRALNMSLFKTFVGPKWRTWLGLGGPRPSQIEAETRKNRCWKTTRFWHRFLKGSDVVLEGFLEGFWEQKYVKFTKSRF